MKNQAEFPEGSPVIIVTFVSAKKIYNDEKRYAFYRTADAWASVRFAGQAENPQNQPRAWRRALRQALRREQHLVVMLYAVIKRFDSLREISGSMFPDAHKLAHLGIGMMPRRSTLSDTNARRPESIFGAIYRSLYDTYKDELSSDSRRRQVPKWLAKLQIIDSTTITLFSSLVFKGAEGTRRHLAELLPDATVAVPVRPRKR